MNKLKHNDICVYCPEDVYQVDGITLSNDSNIIKLCKEFGLNIGKLKFKHHFYKQYENYRDLYYDNVYIGSESIEHWCHCFPEEGYKFFRFLAISIAFNNKIKLCCKLVKVNYEN